MNSHILDFVLFGNSIVVTPWKVIGMIGALMFASRWFVQAYYSRKAGRPITPRLFWVMSMVGSITTLTYFIFSPKQDMVGIMQNLFPFMIAAYNLYLDARWEQQSTREHISVQPESVAVHTPAEAAMAESVSS